MLTERIIRDAQPGPVQPGDLAPAGPGLRFEGDTRRSEKIRCEQSGRCCVDARRPAPRHPQSGTRFHVPPVFPVRGLGVSTAKWQPGQADRQGERGIAGPHPVAFGNGNPVAGVQVTCWLGHGCSSSRPRHRNDR